MIFMFVAQYPVILGNSSHKEMKPYFGKAYSKRIKLQILLEFATCICISLNLDWDMDLRD